MTEFQRGLGEEKGKKLILAIEQKKIIKDNRTNHGKDFMGGYEQLYKKEFYQYLSSCTRYLDNKRLHTREYYG